MSLNDSTQRSDVTTSTLLQKLKLDSNSSVLAIGHDIKDWLGFSSAKVKNCIETEKILPNKNGSFNRVIISDVLNRMNGEDLKSFFAKLSVLLPTGGGHYFALKIQLV